jgi:AIR synthase-related protein
MNLAAITTALQNARGIAHKADIAPVLARLGLHGDATIAVGDDCAAIPDGEEFLLFAIEGFVPEFVADDPYFAGYCGVMVNLSDIAAMGGRPVAVVDALWSRDAAQAAPILAGLKDAADRYGVPVVGGHTNSRAGAEMLSVAVLGRARKLLTSFDARPGQNIIAAIDLRGRMRDPAPYWDASTTAPAARLRADLEILPAIAEAGLCRAAKDISMAGIAGTLLMLLEASKLGGFIDLAAIPRPAEIPLERWLLAFPSFGYLLSVAPQDSDEVIACFTQRGIAAGVIGGTDDSRNVTLRHGAAVQNFWRFEEKALTGCIKDRIDA